jgi:hypothetical protein
MRQLLPPLRLGRVQLQNGDVMDDKDGKSNVGNGHIGAGQVRCFPKR